MSPTNWQSMPCISFDLETTGVNPFEDRIVQAALVKIVPDLDPWAPPTVTTRTWLVDPGIEIPEGAAAIHGITTERARAEATHPVGSMLYDVTRILARTMQFRWPTVVMNAPFDLTMLEAENQRHGVQGLVELVAPMPVGPVIDPFVLDKAADRYRPGSRKLVDMAAHYGVSLDLAHDAGADALAAGLIWPAIISAHPTKFAGLTLGGLHMAQIGWRAEQQDGLAKHFRRKGEIEKAIDVESSTGWPLQDPRPVPGLGSTATQEQGALIP